VPVAARRDNSKRRRTWRDALRDAFLSLGFSGVLS
jgi:hypothetical protein